MPVVRSLFFLSEGLASAAWPPADLEQDLTPFALQHRRI